MHIHVNGMEHKYFLYKVIFLRIYLAKAMLYNRLGLICLSFIFSKLNSTRAFSIFINIFKNCFLKKLWKLQKKCQYLFWIWLKFDPPLLAIFLLINLHSLKIAFKKNGEKKNLTILIFIHISWIICFFFNFSKHILITFCDFFFNITKPYAVVHS